MRKTVCIAAMPLLLLFFVASCHSGELSGTTTGDAHSLLVRNLSGILIEMDQASVEDIREGGSLYKDLVESESDWIAVRDGLCSLSMEKTEKCLSNANRFRKNQLMCLYQIADSRTKDYSPYYPRFIAFGKETFCFPFNIPAIQGFARTYPGSDNSTFFADHLISSVLIDPEGGKSLEQFAEDFKKYLKSECEQRVDGFNQGSMSRPCKNNSLGFLMHTLMYVEGKEQPKGLHGAIASQLYHSLNKLYHAIDFRYVQPK